MEASAVYDGLEPTASMRATHVGRLARQQSSCRPRPFDRHQLQARIFATVSVSSCATPRRRIDNRTVSPGRRRWTASSRRLGPVTGDTVERQQLVAAIEAGDVHRRVLHRRRGNPRRAVAEVERHVANPGASGAALAKNQAGAREQRRVVDDLATLNEAIEEIVRECAIAGHVGEHVPQILHGVGARNRPFDRRRRTPELLPHPAHVVVQRHLVIGAGPQRQIEAEADDGAPVVVRHEVVVDIRRVAPTAASTNWASRLTSSALRYLRAGLRITRSSACAHAPGKLIDAPRDRPAAE